MSSADPSVHAFLSGAPHARVVGQVDLGFGRSAAIWQNRDCHVRYDSPAGHTFSFYTRNGTGTRRTDGRHPHGWPGAVCILPEGVSSNWEITSDFEFLHLYLPDAELRRAYAETFDRDARMLDLADVTYAEAEDLTAPFLAMQAATRSGDPVRSEQAMTELVAAVFTSGRFATRRAAALAGGLAPGRRRRVTEYIAENLAHTLRLRDLAALAGLSEFHFQRAFVESTGVSPHVWIAHRRIDRAQSLIRAGEPLAQIAAACGFSSQSHFTRAFRAATGTTPAAWRATL